jgi:DNA-binding response OmpR family regulator
MSREEIYQNVWGEADNDFIFSKTIDVYIWYLRKKLGKEVIQTRKWYWYIIE